MMSGQCCGRDIRAESGTLLDQKGVPIAEQDRDARTWGMLCHLSALVGLTGIPLLHILGPLIVWQIKKNDYPFVDDQGKEALNFQLTMTIYGLIAGILIMVFIGLILLGVLIVVNVILVAIAASTAYRGEPYRYPFTIRFIK